MKVLCIALSLLFLCAVGSASGLTNAGREFFLAFFRNRLFDRDPLAYLLVTPSQPNGSPIPFTVDIPRLRFTAQGTATSGSVVQINLPKAAMVSRTSGFNNVIHVRASNESEGDLVVVGVNEDEASTDSYLALPSIRSPTGAYEYAAFSTGRTTLIFEGSSAILAVGTEDSTEVTITPTSAASVRVLRPQLVNAGESVTYTINRMSMMYAFSEQDLTGTVIRSNKPLSVFVGHECGNVPFNVSTCDHLLEQIPPSDMWGRVYHTSPLFTRTGGDWFRVVASKNSTEVKMECVDVNNNNGSKITAFELDYFKFETLHVASSEYCRFQSTLPILVTQYSLSQSFDNALHTDPFISLIQSDEQFLNSYSFSTIKGEEKNLPFRSYINLIVPTVHYDPEAIIIDGNPLLTYTSRVKSIVDVTFTKSFNVTVITLGDIPFGSHYIAHIDPSAGFAVLVYGYTDQTSYGFPGGYGQGLISISTFSLEVESASEREDKGPFVFRCKREGLIHFPVDITVATQELVGGAIAGRDFVPLREVLHFAAGEVEKTMVVAVIDDNMEEPDHSFKLTLLKETGQASVALTETGHEVQLTILDNDAPIIIELISHEYKVTEDEKVLRVGVRRTGFISTDLKVVLQFRDDDVPTDVVNRESFVIEFDVWFNKSNTDRVAVVYVNIPIEDDDVVTEDRNYVVQLFQPIGGQDGDPLPPLTIETQRANISVTEDDVVTFEYPQDFMSVSEGDKEVEVCVNKIGETTLRLAVGVISSAASSRDGMDFQPVNIDLAFNAADHQRCFMLQLIDDQDPEPLENFTLNLFNLEGQRAVIGQQGQLTVQIADDDTILVGFRDDMVMGDEGMASTICIEHSPNFTATLPFTVTVTGGNASASDYRINLPNNNMLSVVGSTTQNCFMVSIVRDGLAEGTEVVELTLAPGSSIPANLSLQITMATTQLVISEMDMIGVVFIGTPLVNEGGSVELCAMKFGALTTQVIRVTIEIATTTDPAVVDAVNFDPVLVFQPRTTRNCTRVTVPNDDVVSASAFLQFRLSSYESEGAKVMLAPRLLALTIFDNDVLPIGFNTSQLVVDEGVGMVTVCVVTGSEFRNQVSLELFAEVESTNTNATGGNDYSAFQEIAVLLNLEGGQKETCFNVSIVDDSIHEADEVIGLRLVPGVEVSGSFILRNTRTSIVVRDDDIVVVQMESMNVTVSEKEALVQVCVLKVGKTDLQTTVLLAAVPGSAEVNADFLFSNMTVSIEPEVNRTCVFVPILDDTDTEFEENLFVTLSTVPTTFERTMIGEPNRTEVIIQDDDLVEVHFEESRITVNESVGTVEVCLVKEGVTSRVITVTVVVQELLTDNSASVSSDLATQQLDVTFRSGMQRACGGVQVVDDAVVEEDEVVALNISETAGMNEEGQVMFLVGERAHVVMEIRDDDVATIMFPDKTVTIIEGEPPFLLCLTLNGTTAVPLVVGLREVDVNATSGEDYVSINGAMLTFAPFTNIVCTNLTITDDEVEEEDEVFMIEVSSLTEKAISDQSAVLVTIKDDDSLRFRFTEGPFIRNESVGEALLLCVEKRGLTVQDFEFDINTTGSATDGVDYVLGASVLQFASDQVEACFEVEITNDSLLEGNEVIHIILTASGLTPLNTSVTIIDDDSAVISFDPVMYQTSEASGGVRLRVVISGEVAIPLAYLVEFLPMSASRRDFNSSVITRMLPLLGGSDSVLVEVFDDAVPEGREMFEARLVVPSASAEKGLQGSLTANGAIVIIEDNDVVNVSFASGMFTVQEGDGVAMVTIQTDKAAANDLTLRVSALSSFSATAGDDFVPVRQAVTLPAGSTSAHVNISIVDDALAEPTEAFNVTLTIDTPHTLLLSQLGSFPEATVAILDNDRISFEWEREVYRVREGAGLLSLQVVSHLAASYDITLEFEVNEISAQENQNFEILTSSPLVIPAGDMSVAVVINILNDTIFDGNKTFALRLLTLTAQDDVDISPVLGSSVVTMVTIMEDDMMVVLSFEKEMYILTEGDKPVEVCLITEGEGLPMHSISVPIKFINRTAISGEDFVPPSPSLVPFSIGQRRSCVQVGIIDDSLHEQTEVFAVRMDSASSSMPQEVAAGRTNLSRLSIRDNDSPARQCTVNSTIIVPFHRPNSTSPNSYAIDATCQHVLVSTCSNFMRGPIRIDADFRNDQIETLAVRIGSTQVLFLSNGTFIQSNTPTVGEGGVFSPVTVVQTDSEISLNSGNGSIVVTRRYGDNPSISITLPRGMLRSGMCGLCGNEEGMLAFRSTFPLRANFSEADLTRFIKSWKVDFEEGLFPVDPLDTECATMRNDSMDVDPLLTIPLYLHNHPVEVYRKVALCYEVRGHAGTIYNLISDKCVSVNGKYKELATLGSGFNVLGAVGVVVIDNQGECVTISVEEIMGTCMTKVNGELLFSSYKKNGVVVDVAHDKVQISAPNCEMVDLVLWIMCQEMAGHDMIKFVVTRGVNMRPTSHGLLGQYWNVPAYVSKVDSRSHSYQVTLKYSESKQREFSAVYYRYTWLWRRTPCLYAGDSQGNGATVSGKSVLEGSILDYVMDSLLDTEYSFSRFEGGSCTRQES